MSHDVLNAFMVAAAVYFGGFVMFFIVWSILYVINLIDAVITAWCKRVPIKSRDLDLQLEVIVPMVFYPVIWPFLLGLIVMAILLTPFHVFEMVWKMRLKPFLKNINYRSNYKLLPTWLSNASMASALNKLIGYKDA